MFYETSTSPLLGYSLSSSLFTDVASTSWTPSGLQLVDHCRPNQHEPIKHRCSPSDQLREHDVGAIQLMNTHPKNTLTWEDVRPIFTQLYIDQNLRLEDVRDQIHHQYGFGKTLQQYKKRIRAWDLKKVMKVQDKDVAIEQLLQSLADGRQTCLPTSPELKKIQRRARSRYKDGTLSEPDLLRILQAAKAFRKPVGAAHIRPITTIAPIKTPTPSPKTPAATPATPQSCESISWPPSYSNTDKLYLSLPAVISRYNSISFLGIRNEEQEVAFALDAGLVSWKLEAFDKSRDSFTKASLIIYRQMQMNTMPEITLIYYLLPEAWPDCLDVFSRLARFIEKAATEVLGAAHQFAIFIRLLCETASTTERGLSIWNRIFESLRLTRQNQDQWVDASIYRARFCRRNKQPDLAVAICRKASAELGGLGPLPDHLAIDLSLELAEALEFNSDYLQAVIAFQETVEIACRDPRRFQEYRLRALERLAQINEVRFLDFDQARVHYVEAFRVAFFSQGADHSETLYLLRELIRFCGRQDILLESLGCSDELDMAYTHAERTTTGEWYQ